MHGCFALFNDCHFYVEIAYILENFPKRKMEAFSHVYCPCLCNFSEEYNIFSYGCSVEIYAG